MNNKAQSNIDARIGLTAPLLNSGMKEHFAGNLKKAGEIYQQVLKLYPEHCDALHFMGVIKLMSGELDEAISLITKSIKYNNRNAPAFSSLATAYTHSGKSEKAIENFRKSLAMNPNDASTYNNYGFLLMTKGRNDEAIENYRKSLLLQPGNAMAWSNLGISLKNQGRIEEAVECYRKAFEVQPGFSHGHSNMLFSMHYSTKYNREEIFRHSLEWASKFAPENLVNTRKDIDMAPDRKLRIGYVSSDFTAHPVSYAMMKVFEFHDKNDFEIFCYANNKNEDKFTDILKSRADHWRKISGVNDDDAAEMIRQDKIDILIDLSGHTSDNRLQLFAHKPAPVQVTWFGYFNTTAMKQMDYIIADRFVFQPGDEKFFTEKPLMVDGSYTIWHMPEIEGEAAELPCLKNNQVTFCSFNNISKMNEEVIEVWAKILQQVPDSQLFLKSKALDEKTVTDRIAAAFSAHGITKDRLRFAGHTERAKHLLSFNEVDIGLDPFPYNGGTTTVEAMWMGVPVVTLRGDSFLSRVGTSMLGASSMDEFIAGSKEEYIDKAVALAWDKEKLSEIRKGLRGRISSSPIFDGEKATRSVEQQLRKAWRGYIELQHA